MSNNISPIRQDVAQDAASAPALGRSGWIISDGKAR